MSPLVDSIARQVAVVIGEQLRAGGLDSGAAVPWAYGIVGLVHQAGDWWLDDRTMTRERARPATSPPCCGTASSAAAAEALAPPGHRRLRVAAPGGAEGGPPMIRPTKPHSLPSFDSVEAERAYIKQRMAAAFRLFDRFGFNEGIAGHLTARDPELTDTFWVNPFGLSFGLIRAQDMIRVDHNGAVVEGDWPVNIAAFAIHSQLHQARPDVMAAAHTHSKPAGRGRRWGACSIRSPRTPAPSSRTTACSTTTRAW